MAKVYELTCLYVACFQKVELDDPRIFKAIETAAIVEEMLFELRFITFLKPLIELHFAKSIFSGRF